MYHRLIPMHLLIHINLELRNRDKVPPAKVVKEHHSRELPVVIMKHGADKVLISDGHVDEVLPVLGADPTRHVQMMLVEIKFNEAPDDFPADCDSGLKLINDHGGVGQVADADEGLDGLPMIDLHLISVWVDSVVGFNL